MIVQIDFKAQSRSGNLKGRVKLRCSGSKEAEEWLKKQVGKYNMKIVQGSEITLVPEMFAEDSYLQDVIEI